jgi:hypothetical protein
MFWGFLGRQGVATNAQPTLVMMVGGLHVAIRGEFLWSFTCQVWGGVSLVIQMSNLRYLVLRLVVAKFDSPLVDSGVLLITSGLTKVWGSHA